MSPRHREWTLQYWIFKQRPLDHIFLFSANLGYINSNKMHDINGYVYGNLPGLSMCRGERVAWHIMSGILMHSATFYGNTILFDGKRTDSVGLIQGEPEQKRKTLMKRIHCHPHRCNTSLIYFVVIAAKSVFNYFISIFNLVAHAKCGQIRTQEQALSVASE